jgi:hypothetical protein
VCLQLTFILVSRTVEDKTFESISIEGVLQLLERYEDYITFANILLWLLRTPHNNLCSLLIPYIQQYEYLLFCLGMIFDFISVLQAKVSSLFLLK